MRVVRDLREIDYDGNSAITVGTFDGIHTGHLQIIKKLNSIKEEKGLRSVLVTFEPHPQVVLKNKATEVKILTTFEEKLQILSGLNLDIVIVIEFTKEFSNTSAEDFYEKYLIGKIGLHDLVLGYDHMFGKNREGNLETLKLLSKKYNFAVDQVKEFQIDGEHTSSTAIRRFLNDGNVKKAATVLGRYYSLSGTVIDGKKLGKELGFPTANITVDSVYKLIPKIGIYAVEIWIDEKKYYGMMSIGKNPTVSSDDEIKLEVNIFEFSGDIYGKNIRINFIEYIRDEIKFENIEELKKQMQGDRKEVKKIIEAIKK